MSHAHVKHSTLYWRLYTRIGDSTLYVSSTQADVQTLATDAHSRISEYRRVSCRRGVLRRGDAGVYSFVRRLRQLGAAAVQPRLSDAPPSSCRACSNQLARWLLRRRSTRTVSSERAGVV